MDEKEPNKIEIKCLERKSIDYRLINRLPQPRKTFKDIESLAENIGEIGLLTPLFVACFNKKECKDHLKISNSRYKKETKIKELKSFKDPTGEDFYYILISGERRHRAIELLEKNGHPLEKIFPGKKVGCQIYRHLNWEDFCAIQASENIHKQLEPNEEAEFYADYLLYLREVHGQYHLNYFAKRVGRDEKTIRNAVRFFLLPSKIKEMVGNQDVRYGVACQIGRLNERGDVKEEQLMRIAIRAGSENWQTGKAKKEIERLIGELDNRQEPIFILTEEDRERQFKGYFRKNFTIKMTSGILDFISNLKFYNYLINNEILSKSDYIFRTNQVLKIYLKMAEEMKSSYPQLLELLKEEKEEIKEIVRKSGKAAKKILVYSKLKEIFKTVEAESKKITI